MKRPNWFQISAETNIEAQKKENNGMGKSMA
ncbi:hypothetical protein PHDIMM138B_16105 [Phytobacter diazotrophicus]|jgi:hypothetical protein